MQIDFHHGTTYVCARMAGFSHEEADIIAYSAQYVDEATNDGILKFEEGQRYTRMASAHKMIDRRNFSEAANHKVWVPFHFLPGNNGIAAGGEHEEGSFIKRLVCKPYSDVAVELLDTCIEKKNKPYALHRLGITMHVFADTFAHQGFAGIQHKINEVHDLKLLNEEIDMSLKLSSFFENIWDSVTQNFLSDVVPLGHGPALTCPDKPYLEWSYTNGLGEPVNRKNLDIFMEAVEAMVGHMILFRNDATYDDSHLEQDFAQIKRNFEFFREEKGDERHERWKESIANGDFSFDSVEIEFVAKGNGSWKHKAVGTEKSEDIENDRFIYKPEFLQSDWKLFHDALQSHYFDVIHDILPKYDICVA